MLWRRFSTSCSFYSLTFPAMRTAGVAHNPFLDCVLWPQAAAGGLALSSAGGGKWPKGAFRNSSGSQEDSPDPAAKVLGRHQASVLIVESLWICSACFSHSSTTCKSTGVLRRDVLSWRKEKHCRGQDCKGLLHGDGHFLAQRWVFSKHLKHSRHQHTARPQTFHLPQGF